MQAVKDKLQDMKEMHKAKAEAKAEEKAEKELAKARMDIAHEVRLAREAEAQMQMHAAKAGEKADREAAKRDPYASQNDDYVDASSNDNYATTNTTGAPIPDNPAPATGPYHADAAAFPQNRPL